MTDEEIKEKAGVLAGLIQNSETYRIYTEQKNRISRHPELYAQVNSYREENYKLQNSPQTEDLFDRVSAFEKKYADFRNDPLVDEFLRAELALCRLMQEIENIIVGGLDFDLHGSDGDDQPEI